MVSENIHDTAFRLLFPDYCIYAQDTNALIAAKLYLQNCALSLPEEKTHIPKKKKAK